MKTQKDRHTNEQEETGREQIYRETNNQTDQKTERQRDIQSNRLTSNGLPKRTPEVDRQKQTYR